MLHIVKTTNLIIKRTPLLCGLLFAAMLALLPISAQAQCANWDARQLSIIQRGQPYAIGLSLEQNGRVLTGTALLLRKTGFFDTSSGLIDGTVDGTIDGNNFSVQIFWPDDLTGVYNGKVLPSGRLDGETYDKNNSNIRQPWHSEGVLKCAPPPVKPPPPPPPKLIKSSGKARTEPAPPPPTPPFIIGSQAISPTPFDPFGIVYLGWDGGPDHPNVEVWLAMDNGAEIPAFSIDQPSQSPVWKQPKIASIPLQLQRNHLYKFVLKAAGKTLSTVVVAVR